MVDAVVSFVVGSLREVLLQEAAAIHSVRSHLEWVERELTWMQSFLKDADSKEENGNRVKNWAGEVRDIAYDVEDVVYAFKYYTERYTERWRSSWLFCFIGNCVFFIPDALARRRFVNEIEVIKKKLQDISQRRLTYGIRDIDDVGVDVGIESLQEWRQTSPRLEDTQVFGIEEDIRALVAKLSSGESERFSLSIVGIGGLGKTILARKVYNSETVKNYFDCSAWVCVSQQYTITGLLRSILKQFGISTNEEHEIQLKEMLLEHLKQRRYFIVLDDIWDEKAWYGLEVAFPNTNNGSRILLTTRRKDVALHAQSILHELRFLGEDESWELFCKKTFGEQCPPNLEKVGRQIVAKCGGLPLAIVVVGGLLSRKTRVPAEWEKFLRNISWQFVEGNTHITKILVLSYNDLPYHLKPCFLYLGIFPEDHEFYAKKMVRLWIAEGFIRPRGSESLEEVAEAYLEELIDRSLVQVARRSCNIGVRSCRVHDLIRDLSMSKAKENKFLEVHHDNLHSLPSSRLRRLAIHHEIQGYSSFHNSTPYLRSFFCFTLAEERPGKNLEKLLFNSRLLRVLDMYGVPLPSLPNEIGELIHLRYLGCRRSNLKCLPQSIGSLCNLQTLDVTSSKLIEIPKIILKMRNLRHVRVKGKITTCSFWYKTKGNLLLEHDCMNNNIQTLTYIEAGIWIKDYLVKLTNLKKLGIWGKDWCKHGEALSISISKLKKLRYLKLGEWDDCSISTLPSLSLHYNLYTLFLHGKLEKLPDPHGFPPNLTKLTLRMTRLKDDPMPTLEKVNNLRILKLLDNAYVGKEMVCSRGGFLQLKSLHIVHLSELEEWKVEQGAMPSLLHLSVDYCLRLERPPQSLQHLITLVKFESRGMRSHQED